MQIVGRIGIPKSVEVANLYLQCSDKTAINYDADPEVIFAQQGVISTNSYFNSWYETFYSKYTILDKVYCLLQLEGDFQISVYRELQDSNTRQLISGEQFLNCQLVDEVKVKLPDLQSQATKGRIYFELTCLSQAGKFKAGSIVTPQLPEREISLAIVTCTFKKEVYIKQTIDTITQDILLKDKSLEIFVVDNGETLSHQDFADSRIKLISHRNVGGSGGFARGMVEALSDRSISHILLMDDDILLDSECIYRLFALYEYAKFDFAIAGTMLDLYKKHLLYEAGSLYARYENTEKYFDPTQVVNLKRDLELQDPHSLNQLLTDDDVDYGGFWFFAVSREVVEKSGLLMPFFIKVDDIEFGLRIKNTLGRKIVAFPSIAVWHEPFYSKVPIWDEYYNYRNNLIAHAIHKNPDYKYVISFFTKQLISHLLLFDYNSAEMLVKGFEDFTKGPDYLKTHPPEVLHANVLELSKSHPTQQRQFNYVPPEQEYSKTQANIWQKIVSLLTLNGHLLPGFSSKGDVYLWQSYDYAGQRSKVFGKQRVFIFKQGSSYLFQNEIDRQAGISLLTRWLKVATISGIKWTAIANQWKTAAKELTSATFWQQYLGMEKTKQNV